MAIEYRLFSTLDFKIDAEFKSKIPAMRKEEYEGLKGDIINDGYIRNPLVVWQEENTLLDGHHRWQIKQEVGDRISDTLPIEYRSFPDRWAAIVWICSNQLHQHNMDDVQKRILIQEQHDAQMKTRGGDHKSSEFKNQSGPKGHIENEKDSKIRKEIAREHNVSEKYVRNSVEFGRGIQKADEVVPGFKNKVETGEVKISVESASALRKMESEPRKQAVEAIMRGEKPSATTKKNSPIKQESWPMTTMADLSTDHSTNQKRNYAGSAELRELYRTIDEAYAPMINKDAQTDVNLDDLLSEIRENGDIFIISLSSTITTREHLLIDDDAKRQVSDAIAKIIEGITNLKRRYEK